LINWFHFVLGEECLATDFMDTVLPKNQRLEPASCGEIQADSRMLDEQLDNAVSNGSQLNNLNSSGTSDFPAPEKMLSVPEGFTGIPNDLLVESTPDKEDLPGGDGAGIKLTGKKRSFTESTLTVQSLNSVESFGMTLSKRTAESIPDDDDLLSSILGIKWFFLNSSSLMHACHTDDITVGWVDGCFTLMFPGSKK
jgi:cohesin complex subunit SCC1